VTRPAPDLPPRWSLRRRLLRNVLLAVAGGWIATAAVGTFALNHEMREMLDQTLEGDAELVLNLLEASDGAAISQWVDAHPDSDTQIVRIFAAGQTPPPAPWAQIEQDGIHQLDGWVVLRRSSEIGTTEIGQSLDWRFEEVIEAARAFLLLTLPLLGLVALGVIAALRGGLLGLSAFTQQMKDRSPDNLAPLPTTNLPQELSVMADGLNVYLDRIHDLRRAERRFIAHAAHELRTPLAIIRTRLQLISGSAPAAPHPDDVIKSIDHLSRRVERLLQQERAEAGLGVQRQDVDLVGLIRLVCAEQRAQDRGRLVFDDSDLETCRIASDADATAIILRNLLDNALEHGEGPVWLTLTADLTLTIRNGVGAGGHIRLDPFAKSFQSTGYGLGLNIVTTMCRNLGIALRVRQDDTTVEIRLSFSEAATH